MLKHGAVVAIAAMMLAACGEQAAPIEVTGSSTVYPFTRAVAERFAKEHPDEPAPAVKEVGTVSGFSSFCAGPGLPDMIDASRRMTRKEFDSCAANKTGELMEIPIGLDGIALAESNAGPKLSLTGKDLYLALAANPLGKPNTAKTWRDVNPALPAIPIKVIGPPASSGTRDSFVRLIMAPGCIEAVPEAAALQTGADPAKFDMLCTRLREDGAYVTGGEDDNAVVKTLEGDKNAVALFGYSYLEQNASRLRGVPIDGVVPDTKTIAGGTYKGGRLLYLYVKKGRLQKKPAMQEFLNLYAEMWKPEGPLTKLGLVAMSDSASRKAAATVKDGYPLSGDGLY